MIDSLKQELHGKNKKKTADIYYLIGDQFFPANSDSALVYTEQALRRYREIGDQGDIYKCMGLLIGVYGETGMSDTSIEIGFEVLKWAEANEEYALYANTCLEIGNSFAILNNQHLAKVYYQKAINGKNDHARLAAYANLGLIYLNSNNPDSAYHYFYSARENYLKKDTSQPRILFNLAVLNSNLGSVEFLRNNYQEGIRLVRISMNIAKTLKSKTFIAGAFNKMGEGYAGLNMPDSAVFYFQKAIGLANSIGYLTISSDVYSQLSDLYEREGDLEKALVYFKKHYQLNDSLSRAEEETSLEKLNLKHQLWVKGKNIELLKSSNKNLWLTGVLIILTLVIVSLVVIEIINRRRQKLKNTNILVGFRVEKQRLKLDIARKKLIQTSEHIIEQNILIENMENELRQLKKSVDRDVIEKKLLDLHRKKILTDNDWIEYLHSFAELYPGFFAFINNLNGISEGDKRQLVFVKLGFNLKESSYLMGVSTEGIKRARQRLSKKLDLPNASQLKDFVENKNEVRP